MLGLKANFFAGGKHKVTENDFYRNYGMGNCVERAVHWKCFYHCNNDYALESTVVVERKDSGGYRESDCRKCCNCRGEEYILG